MFVDVAEKQQKRNFAKFQKKLLTMSRNIYTIRTVLAIPLAKFQRLTKKQKMKTVSLHRQFISIAKQAGFVPTYWSCEMISLGNDRTPDTGSWRTVV